MKYYKIFTLISLLSINSAACGTNHTSGIKIVGGKVEPHILDIKGSFPSTVAFIPNTFGKKCTGTRIGDDLFLTAAHCFDSSKIENKINVTASNGQKFEFIPADIRIISGYIPNDLQTSDLATFRVKFATNEEKFVFDQVTSIATINLDQPLVDQKVLIAGFGCEVTIELGLLYQNCLKSTELAYMKSAASKVSSLDSGILIKGDNRYFRLPIPLFFDDVIDGYIGVGDSGGPVYNVNRELIGVNAASADIANGNPRVLLVGGISPDHLLTSSGVQDPNKAYPALLTLLPSGLKGLSFAALTAAIVASLAGKANSIATIFTLDIYKKAFNPNASETRLVNVGKVSVVVSVLLAVALSFVVGEALMGEGKQGFQYIQEYTGFVSPGIFAMFIFGFFWKKTTSNAALFATIGGFVTSVILKFLPRWVDLSGLYNFGWAVKNGDGIYEIPFMDRMLIVFAVCAIGMYIISIYENKKGIVPKGLEIEPKMFKTNWSFAVGSILTIALITLLYTIYW
ncbi:MAG: trypsin-like serine protease [Pedobacter sp.]|nr:MAG: trypsin-like serine protease [Pedobacter sp.]